MIPRFPGPQAPRSTPNELELAADPANRALTNGFPASEVLAGRHPRGRGQASGRRGGGGAPALPLGIRRSQPVRGPGRRSVERLSAGERSITPLDAARELALERLRTASPPSPRERLSRMPMLTARSRPEVWVALAGVIPYRDARRAQKLLEAARLAGEVPDLLLLLEHPPVYTRGRRATAEDLPMGTHWYRGHGIDVCDTDRGGRVTYHGPGQLVGYPIVSLRPYGDDVHAYIRRLERTMIAAMADWGVDAGTIPGLTGVWTKPATPGARHSEATSLLAPEAKKIGSIGVHVNRGVTTHGFAINVNNALEPFEWIVPCGIESCRMTSLASELGAEQDLGEFATAVRDRFGEVYDRLPVEVSLGDLAERVTGLESLLGVSAALR